MRFGLFFQVPEATGQTHAERYAEMFDLIALADSLGFDVAWLAELHFGGAFSLLANPLMTVPVIAQRTRRIRIGTAVTLLPLHHPLSCAEHAATADLLSGGRLEFGVGRGSIPSQFHGFRVPVAENRARFDEALDIIRLAWTRERFSYRGAFYQVEDVAVVPKPVQRPIRRSASRSIWRRASPTSATWDCPSIRGRRPRPCRSFASTWRSTALTSPPPGTPGRTIRWR
jgi:alkanesulfonate monooxygenase SsuD/methylene tetrahydromethanopterin reductase-like flavin-dependent oxidoreductase (luciferase family)